MPFSKEKYPDSWKNFYADVREKAIDIANSLLKDKGMNDQKAIAIATSQAKKWAENHDKKIYKDREDS